MVSLDGDPIMETTQVCDDNPGEVDSVGESAIWTAQQGTRDPCRESNSVIQCVQRTAAITKPLTCRRVVTSPSGQVNARLATRGNEQEVHGHEVVTLERLQPDLKAFAGVGGDVRVTWLHSVTALEPSTWHPWLTRSTLNFHEKYKKNLTLYANACDLFFD